MKKITIFFLAVVGIITLGTVSSCKDYDDDCHNDLRAQQVSMDDALRKLIEAQKTELLNKISAINSCECDTAAIGKQIRDLQAKMNGKVDKTVFEDSIKKLSAKYADLSVAMETMKSTLASLEKAYKAADSILNLRVDSVNLYVLRLQDSISDINGRLRIVEGYDARIKANLDSINVLKTNYSALRDSLSDVKAKANANDEWIKAMKQLYGDSLEKLGGPSSQTIITLRHEADSLFNRSIKLSKQYTDSVNNALKITLNTRIDSVRDAFVKADEALQKQIDTLKTDVKDVKDRLLIVEGQIDQLKGVVDNLINRLNSQITSIIVQSITTPLLLDANLALPVGLQTNVVCAYTGSVKNGDVIFPTSSKSFNLADPSDRLTNDEMNNINEEEFPQGTPLISTGGKLYLTINPSDVNFTGAGLKLVNSQNAESGFRIVNVQKSNTLIKFASRAEDSGNGFYEADFELYDADQTALNTAPLKTAAKEVYHLLKNRTGVREMAKAVVNAAYKTVSLPAYAVQAPYSWVDAKTGEKKTSYVHSNYNIAATSVHPLSYNLASALEDLGVSTKIPHRTIHHIAYLKDLLAGPLNKIHSKLYFEFDDVEPINVDLVVNIVEISFNEITMKATATGTATYREPVKVDPATCDVTEWVDKTANVTINVTVDGTEINQIADAIQKQVIDKLNAELKAKGVKISNDIAQSVNDALIKTANQINTSVEEVIDIIKGYMDKTNSYVDRLNSLIDKINRVLNGVYTRVDNINYYLQPLLLYGDGKESKFHHLGAYATTAGYVTPGKLVLYPTSYTAEILNPAAKKYVTVTKALKLNADGTTGVNDTDEVKRANASGIIDGQQQFYFNEVIPGTIRSVAVDVKSGYAYEFAYAALDYAGYQTVQRYWIRVK